MAVTPNGVVTPTGDDNYDALLWGTKWDSVSGPLTITYAYYTDSEYSTKKWGAADKIGFKQALDAWSAVANINFVEIEPNGAEYRTSNADMSITFQGLGNPLLVGSDTAAYGLFPDTLVGDDILAAMGEDRSTYANPEGDIFVLDQQAIFQETGFRAGSYGLQTFIHEVGHTLGMKHPFIQPGNPGPYLDPQNQNAYDSIMAYMTTQEVDFGEYVNGLRGNNVSPMPFDIRVIQYLYGANMTYHTGDDIYELRADGLVRTIWDAGGIDTFSARNAVAGLQIDLREGEVTRHGGTEGLSATAVAFDTVIENAYGSFYNDFITGNDADNTLDGQRGIDTMTGGLGNDTFYVDNIGDAVSENTGEGTDTIISTISFDLLASAAFVEHLTLTGGTVNGSGTTADNTITGSAGKNTLNGLLGNDVLVSGGGADVLIGGGGDDVYFINLATAQIFENAGEGNDTVNTTVKLTLGAELENIIVGGKGVVTATGNALDNEMTGNGVKNTLSGLTGDDTLSGGAGNDLLLGGDDDDTLDGGDGFDTLNGGAGNDAMAGGLGDDLYIVDVAGDTVTENGGEGVDHVQSAVTFSLAGAAAGVERLTLTGLLDINATGNALNNTLTGNAGSNTLDGGAGADTMLGGAGNDFYIMDSSFDVIKDTGGIDTVLTDVTIDFPGYHYLVPGIENITLTGAGNVNARGGTAANVLTGNTGDNTLDGFNGNDTLIGGAGNDTYIIGAAGDIVSELAGEGTDTVLSTVTFTLSAEVENLTLVNAGNGTGNGVDNILTGGNGANTLSGLAGDDTLVGGLGGDTLLGGLDDDILIGGAGADKLTGGLGDDTFVFNLAPAQGGIDTITDFVSGAGNDVLDIADVLVGYTGTVTDFVQITQVGANTIVRVDANGLTGGSSFVQIATLTGVNLGTDEAALVASGNLIVL